VLRRCVWSRNIKNGCSIYIYIYIYIYDISHLRVNVHEKTVLLTHNLVLCSYVLRQSKQCSHKLKKIIFRSDLRRQWKCQRKVLCWKKGGSGFKMDTQTVSAEPLTIRYWQHLSDNYVTCINLLKPTGYVMHQQFNIQQLYALPTLYLCVLYLSQNKQPIVPLTA